ncbi:MAG: DUF4350 domain-containing protein [Janthinobacterium lividum]
MSAAGADRRIVFWLAGGVLLLILLTVIFAPVNSDDDARPTTYNSGTHGAKAAYLLLGELGYTAARSDEDAVAALDRADAQHTTYILAEPNAPGEEAQKREYAALHRFLDRGGRVLATGFAGAHFLPGGRTGEVTQMLNGLCTTTTEGRSAYAAVGPVSTYDFAPWNAAEPLVRVDHRCGNDAVVVHRSFPNGGEMVWWSTAEPLTNRGIGQDSSLHLLLAAVGPAAGRHVIFDEFYHGAQGSPSDYLKGLPLRSLAAQVLLLFGLLVFSFSRRSGPVRDPVYARRTSPIEFAQNMGALYERAGATQPATEAARRRLLHFLATVSGLPMDVVRGPADGIATMVHSRFRMDAAPLQGALEQAEAARYERLRPREALLVVRNLDRQREHLQAAMKAGKRQPDQEAVTFE